MGDCYFSVRTARKLSKREKALFPSGRYDRASGCHVFLTLHAPDGEVKEYHYGYDLTPLNWRLSALAIPVAASNWNKDGEKSAYSDEIRYKITEDQYDEIKTDLESFSPKIYCLISKNCASRAAEVAERHGFSVPSKGLIVTPDSIGRALKELHREHCREEAIADAIGDCDFAAEYSPDQRDRPRRVGFIKRLEERFRCDNSSKGR